MLCLGRRIGESIEARYGDVSVRITVVDIAGTKVKLGIETTPRDVVVHRSEVWQSIEADVAALTGGANHG